MFTTVIVPFFAVAMDEEKDRKENRVLYFASIVFGLLTCCFCLMRAAELYFSAAQLDSYKSYLPRISNHPIFKSTVSEERSVKVHPIKLL